MPDRAISSAYEAAKERYAAMGVDVESAIRNLETIPVSLHCWQGDDVGGFETAGALLSGGGIQATGNYPGKARNISELRSDVEKAFSLIPGKHRLNLHASYLDNGGEFVDRTEIEPKHFQSWIDWAKQNGLGMDFNRGDFRGHQGARCHPFLRRTRHTQPDRPGRAPGGMAAQRPVDVITGGAAPPSTIIAAMEDLGFRIKHMYGLTESSALPLSAPGMRNGLRCRSPSAPASRRGRVSTSSRSKP